jgi:hypothetical protein
MSLGDCRFRVSFILVGSLLAHLSAPSTRADLVLRDYASFGRVLIDGNPLEDDTVVTINDLSTFTGQFYGRTVGPVRVAENGNLNFTDDPASSSFSPTGFSHLGQIARIAPLWDDFLLYNGSSNAVIDSSVTGQFLAVTWKDVLLFNDTPEPNLIQTFQVVWFEKATTVEGFQFEANDIAFGYQGSPPNSNNFGNLNAVVGITDDAGRKYAALPGTFDGVIQSPDLLAWQENQFLLFRPLSDPTQGYSASMEFFSNSVVPEPSSLILLGCIAPAYLFYRLRKRRPHLVVVDR